jgi:NADH:ubiquinone oxidoreductase subunit 4 (subunit M)
VVGLMSSTSHFPFLTVLVLTPAVGAAVVALIPPHLVAKRFHEAVGALVGLFTLVLSVVIAGQFKVATSWCPTMSGPSSWASTGRSASMESPCSWW